MRGGFGGGATPPTGGLGGRTPQKLGLSNKIVSNTKSVEYRLHIKRGTDWKIEAEITPIRQSEYCHAWWCQLWHRDCFLSPVNFPKRET
jgi:hypothetical protein